MTTTTAPRRTTSGSPIVQKRSLSEITSAGSGLPNRYVLHGPEKWGKCLGKGTPVLMFDGTVKPVEAVEEGDLLMGPDSTPRHVAGLHSGYGPLYKVLPNRGVPYVVNWKHVLSLKMSRGRRSSGTFHEILNIPVEDYLRLPPSTRRDAMGWRVAVEWPQQELPIEPYLFGCWIGDGTSVKPEITTPEPEVEMAMAAYADANGMRVVHRADAGKAATLAITTERSGGRTPNKFTDALHQLGVFGNKHIPWIYKTASRAQRLELLAGIIDTDGYLYGNCFDLTLKAERLAEDIVFVARSLGFCATIVPCQKTCTNNGVTGTYYRFKISGHTDRIPTRVPRRQASRRGVRSRDPLVTGFAVEPIGDGEFFGFEVDRDHLFLLGDFTVTHNTSFAAQAPKPIFVQSKGETGLDPLIDSGRIKETAHFPESQDWSEFLGCIRALIDEEHKYTTLVIDTLNGAERLCHEFVCARDFGSDWGDHGFASYSKGPEVAIPEWRVLLSALDELRRKKRMTIFALCHTKVAPYRNPTGADYDRFQPDMDKRTWALTAKWADVILFGAFDETVAQVRENKKTGEQKGKGLGGNARIMYTEKTAAYDAGNRLGLAPEIEMGDSPAEAWTNFMAAVKAGRQQQQQPEPQPQPEQQQPTQEATA